MKSSLLVLLFGSLLFVGCSDDDGTDNSEPTTTDASDPTDATDPSSTDDASDPSAPSGACTINGFTSVSDRAVFQSADNFASVEGITSTDEPFDILSFEFYGGGFGGPTGPGSYEIDGSNYADCGLCVLVYKGYQSNSIEKYFYASEGGVEITAWDEAGGILNASLANAKLTEVTIEPNTYTSTPVAGGDVWCIDSIALNGVAETTDPTDASDVADPSDPSDQADTSDPSAGEDPSDATDATNPGAPAGPYAFDSLFNEGESSVSYSGQIARHVLINEVKALIGSIDPATTTYVPGQVFALLDGIYQHDWTVVPELPFTSLTGNDLQTNLDEISTNKKLINKMAGNDSPGWTQDWAGWATAMPDGTGATAVPGSPDAFAQAMFHMLDDLAVLHSNGTPPLDHEGNAITKAFVDANGVDWQQMAQKFLLGAVAFSQGTNDYLYKIAGVPGDDGVIDDSTAKQNSAPDGDGKAYTSMEHYWDEAFGYFGAAADYHLYTDAEIAGKGGRDDWQKYHDTDGDGKINLKSEYNFGHSQNAAKRDLGSAGVEGGVAYDMTGDVFGAFMEGRTFITSVGADLNAEQLETLRGYIDTVQSGWEKAIAATVIHYINDTLGDMAEYGTDDYSFYSHAKHWSELKGFAMGLQFNPASPMHNELASYCYEGMGVINTEATEAECTCASCSWNPAETAFERFHRKVGDAPVIGSSAMGSMGPVDGAAYGYASQLGSALNVMVTAYGFDPTTASQW